MVENLRKVVHTIGNCTWNPPMPSLLHWSALYFDEKERPPMELYVGIAFTSRMQLGNSPLQGSPLTVTLLGTAKTVTVSGVSLYPKLFSNRQFFFGHKKVSL